MSLDSLCLVYVTGIKYLVYGIGRPRSKKRFEKVGED